MTITLYYQAQLPYITRYNYLILPGTIALYYQVQLPYITRYNYLISSVLFKDTRHNYLISSVLRPVDMRSTNNFYKADVGRCLQQRSEDQQVVMYLYLFVLCGDQISFIERTVIFQPSFFLLKNYTILNF